MPRKKIWNKTTEGKFIAALARTSNVTESLRKASMMGADPYAQPMRSEAFRTASDAALNEDYAEIEVQALDEARNGLAPDKERSAANERLRATLLNAHAKRVGGVHEAAARIVAGRQHASRARRAVEHVAKLLGVKL